MLQGRATPLRKRKNLRNDPTNSPVGPALTTRRKRANETQDDSSRLRALPFRNGGVLAKRRERLRLDRRRQFRIRRSRGKLDHHGHLDERQHDGQQWTEPGSLPREQ